MTNDRREQLQHEVDMFTKKLYAAAEMEDAQNTRERVLGKALEEEQTLGCGFVGRIGLRDECGTQAPTPQPPPTTHEILEMLQWLITPRPWKSDNHRVANHLTMCGLADHTLGWTFLTQQGVEHCVRLGILKP